MSNTWFTSDTHFGHEMVARLRGFESSEEHDAAIVANWNRAVKPDDIVWHLGDVGMGQASKFFPVLALLNGTKHLITGNHDAVWPGHRDSHKHQAKWLAYFDSVQAFAKRRVNDETVLLSHFPYYGDHTVEARHTQFRLRDEGAWLLHGHTHSKEKLGPFMGPVVLFGGEPSPRGRQVHVGLDAWELMPVSLGAIAGLIS